MCAFEADVYSFAMTCSKILSDEDPFDGIDTKKELLKKIEKDERPKLPSNYDGLSKLIEECWTLNPSRRSSFEDICKRLITLKKEYLVKIDIAKTPHFGAFKKEDHERSKSKDVCIGDTLNRINALYFVGMGRIGKTTLAKITFDTIQHMYNVSCFVEGIQKKDSRLSMICKNLEQAEAMMKEVLMSKKFIKIHKFDIGELDKDASLKLFIAYSCREGDELPKELIEFGKEIGRSCNGLPLNLKVLGSFLGGQKRLRFWERALQKLRRGRSLDGDEIDIEEKNMFLDICFFFCNNVKWDGRMIETIIQIWTNKKSRVEEQDASNVLDMLVHQSMIKIEKDGLMKVHDQLKDMDQRIVEEEKEYKDTRIWNANMVPMHGITTKQNKDVFEILVLLVKNANKLKVLLLKSIHYDHLFRFPKNRIKLPFLICTIEFWKVFEELTILILTGFTFRELLPQTMFITSTLMRLDLDGPIELKVLQKAFKNLSNLTNMRLFNNKILNIMSKELTNLTFLKTLNMSGCSSLTSLPNELANLSSLEELYLIYCSSLINLPNEFINLSSLKKT
uniref:Protein kinase domain-containing protein n=2 Tax=Physcomitrium patens TaxID=3218 RepID=A0A7I4BZK1_PHYPA